MNSKAQTQLLILFLCYFTFVFASLALIGLMPEIRKYYSLTEFEFSNLITIFSLTYAIVAFLSPFLLSRINLSNILLLGLLILCIGSFVLGFSNDFKYAFLARVIQAVGAALIGPTASAIALNIVDKKNQGKALGFVFSGTTVASVLGVPLAQWFQNYIPWSYIYFFVGFLTIILIVSCLFIFKGKDINVASQLSFSDFLKYILDKKILLLLVVTFFWLTAQFTFYTLISGYLKDVLNFTINDLTLCLFLFGVSGVLGNAVIGWLVDKKNVIFSMYVTVLLSFIGYFFLLWIPLYSKFWVFVSIFFWGFSTFMFSIPQQKNIIEHDFKNAKIGISLNASFIYLGIAMGALVSGFISNEFDINYLNFSSFLIFILAVLCIFISFKLE